MLALQFRFLAGRYHANPWGRHVNEGDVAWPPEPWRLLRALIANWHHKVKSTGKHDESVLTALISSLSEKPPEYFLPPASHSHTRHYMPQWNPGKTKLVLDAFVAVHPEAPLCVHWPEIELPVKQAELLDDLLDVMTYLGRSESWVEARRVADTTKSNCKPGLDTINRNTGEIYGELINLHAPISAEEYDQRRGEFLSDCDKRQANKLAATLPDDLTGALSLDTVELQKQGWSDPPAARRISYIRPVDALRPRRKRAEQTSPAVTTARFLLIGKPLPRVEASLRMGELMRQAVMSAFGKKHAGVRSAPSLFSGHGLPESNRHQHAFYLPYDSNGDGHLDRLLIHVPDGFDADAQRVIGGLRRLWQRGGGEWRLLLEGMGDNGVGSELTNPSQCWVSATPYMHPWHVKKKFGMADQIRRECAERGLPTISGLKRIQTVKIGSQEIGTVRFLRFRASKSGEPQPDRKGSFWEIRFVKPVTGPLALGSSCHFGLGLFQPN